VLCDTHRGEFMISRDIERGESGRLFEAELDENSSEDQQVAAALEEYGHLLRFGTRPARDEFLARHRRIADVLAECLDGFEMVEGAIGHFAPPGGAGGPAGEQSQTLTLGEYRVIREIGRGGMGVVYEAEQVTLGRRVALKVLPWAASLDPRQRQRFQLEAQAAALLHHEHIVPVFGVGTDRGVHYYAMQFVDGRTLTEVIRELRAAPPANGSATTSPFDRSRAVEITKTVADKRQRTSPGLSDSHPGRRKYWQAAARLGAQAALALEHAHQLGVIHRDIKPSNLMLDARNHLWVTDFGLARLPHGDHDLTPTGDVVGTLRYVSPEQVRGERVVPDARGDIYALGATLYELLTLQPAFSARDRQQLLRRILHDEPPRPRQLNPAIPADLETIILKAMEKEPSARYASARELADDLERFLEDQPVQARRPSLVHRTVKWARRHRAVVVTAAAAVALTLSATMTNLWLAKRRADVALKDAHHALVGQRLTIEYALGAFDRITQSLSENESAAPGSALDDQAKRILPITVSFSDRIPELFSKIDFMNEAIAKARRQSGHARMLLGSPRGRNDYRLAIRDYENEVLRNPKLIWLRSGLIATLTEYASLLKKPEDAMEAESSLRRASEIAATLLTEPEAARSCYTLALVSAFDELVLADVLPEKTRAFDLSLAVKLARQSVDWDPARADSWRVLAVASYRQGDLDSALNAARRSIDLNGEPTNADRFLLAAIHRGQGDISQARHWYDQAVKRPKQEPSPDDDRAPAMVRKQLREETERVLLIKNE
jgi:eukaryotic-like serine/threonine-protein kinase